jgi:hypothetical protein
MPSLALIAVIVVVLIVILVLLFWKGTGKDCVLGEISHSTCNGKTQDFSYDVKTESSRGGKSCLSILKEKHPNLTWKKGPGPTVEYVSNNAPCNNCSLISPVNKETGACRGTAGSAREEYNFNEASEYGKCGDDELPTNTYPGMTYDVSYQIVYVPTKPCDANDVPANNLRFGFTSTTSTTYEESPGSSNKVTYYTDDSGKIIGFDVPSDVVICQPTSSSSPDVTFSTFTSAGSGIVEYLLTLDEQGNRVYFTKGMSLNKDGIIIGNGTYELTIRVKDFSAQSVNVSDVLPGAEITMVLRNRSNNNKVGPELTYKLERA